jgi:hypothetical protein
VAAAVKLCQPQTKQGTLALRGCASDIVGRMQQVAGAPLLILSSCTARDRGHAAEKNGKNGCGVFVCLAQQQFYQQY